ncbi:MAG: aldose epimerase family protein [Lachnospiraceae bacterium]|nr:aldose epimerase family protein [Lachnospiraceae bacterium]
MITSQSFGITKDGHEVTAFTITNHKGAKLVVLDYGAVMKDVVIPDRSGNPVDVALGYDELTDYEENPPRFGAVIGRSANRIAGGKFTLNGQEIQLAVNETKTGNNIHSGPDFYEHRMYRASVNEKNNCISFTLNTPDGDQGFPGAFDLTVTYMLTEENKVKIHYEGKSDKDTVVNITNHAYWNLNGSGTAMNHLLQIRAENYTPVDEHFIPTGELASVENTPFDFREPRTLAENTAVGGEQIGFTGGIDHNFVLEGDGLRCVAVLTGDQSGIAMTVLTDQPGMQVYTGNFIRGPKGKGGTEYAPRDGVALETQHFPNSINTPAFASPVLRAGERYSTTTCYAFDIAD